MNNILEDEMERISNLNLSPEKKTNILLEKTTALNLSDKLQEIEHIDSFVDLKFLIDEEMKVLESLLNM